jgi:hypothetical protein
MGGETQIEHQLLVQINALAHRNIKQVENNCYEAIYMIHAKDNEQNFNGFLL